MSIWTDYDLFCSSSIKSVICCVYLGLNSGGFDAGIGRGAALADQAAERAPELSRSGAPSAAVYGLVAQHGDRGGDKVSRLARPEEGWNTADLRQVCEGYGLPTVLRNR